ncbi:MAG: NAD-dependent epimerase/dehydratase family protein [Victivallaceae bacterium]|jgi:UDP-2-acetamido-2,6-beta-L-arabino-hexul-4-ose reductase
MQEKLRVGITGQSGFIGTNLYNFLGMQRSIVRIPFEKFFFQDAAKLQSFATQCDVIIHLAAISRHADGQFMYDTNMLLVRQLIDAMDAAGVKPHVLFASTTHESRDGLYHASKRDGRRLLDERAVRAGGKSTGMLIPNTFGPLGKPFYNSVVSTFCYKIAHGETPEIIVDAPVQLIHVKDLCREIYQVIIGEITANPYSPAHRAEKKVSEILKLLQYFRTLHLERKPLPCPDDKFEFDLFNTLMAYFNY